MKRREEDLKKINNFMYDFVLAENTLAERLRTFPLNRSRHGWHAYRILHAMRSRCWNETAM